MASPKYHSLYLTTDLPGDFRQINEQILKQFVLACDQPGTKRSHYFSGRYENIYTDREYIPALKPVFDSALKGAGRFLRRSDADLSIGFWFNEMQQGQVTLPHCHDEDGELVSAVYYIRVPPDSGDLVLTGVEGKKVITPREGMFVFFLPVIQHEVTENKSGATRLSIGMNFGIRK
ncbi:MAG: 2OG-Fe(II) oxygenase [Gammaproteobacteria bacterium]